MKLDLRLPMGVLFTLIGLLLTGFGLLSDEAIYARSLGINVNLWWGLVLVALGIAMLGLAARGARKLRGQTRRRP
jgi:hypothetical protein